MPERSARKNGALPAFARRWLGLALAAAALVPTLWLSATGQLGLYIHPRYLVFTTIMAALGLVFVLAGVVAQLRGRGHDHGGNDHGGHDHGGNDHGGQQPNRLSGALSAVSVLLALLIAVGLVVVPPATLTAATASQRVVNGSAAGAASAMPPGATAKYTVLDWSAVLRQHTDPGFYRNKAVDVTGFVTSDTSGQAGRPASPDVFYVTRFLITCCAVDAQPVGVPVYLPGWRSHFAPNGWLHITGVFGVNPSTASAQAIVVLPDSTLKVVQPRDPYLY